MSENRTDKSHTESDDRAEAEREVERARRGEGREPHHELGNPADDPDPTEYPDPYDRRRDPRDPAAFDTPASAGERRDEDGDDAPRDPSTSDPPPPRNREQALREGFEPDR